MGQSFIFNLKDKAQRLLRADSEPPPKSIYVIHPATGDRVKVNLWTGRVIDLKEEAAQSLSKSILSICYFLGGVALLLCGILVIQGGWLWLRISPGAEIIKLDFFADLPYWLGWLFMCAGADVALAGGGVSWFIIRHIIAPVVEKIIGKERGSSFSRRLQKLDQKLTGLV